MIDELTLLKLRQDAVESKLARSEIGCRDIRFVRVRSANRGAVAKSAEATGLEALRCPNSLQVNYLTIMN